MPIDAFETWSEYLGHHVADRQSQSTVLFGVGNSIPDNRYSRSVRHSAATAFDNELRCAPVFERAHEPLPFDI